MSDVALSVESLTVAYGSQTVLNSVSFQLEHGASLVVFGPSGSGKTTLLSSILGLTRPQIGRIFISGREMTGAPPKLRARLRRQLVGAIFQSGELLPELTPKENVALPALLDSRPGDTVMRRAEQLLVRLGVENEDRPIGTYSGGEQQRVAVARALINSPDLVVADEPTGALDDATAADVQDLLFDLPKQYGCGLVMVTHDRRAASRAGRVLELTRDRTKVA